MTNPGAPPNQRDKNQSTPQIKNKMLKHLVMQLYDVLKHFVNLTQASFRVSLMTKSEHPPPLRALQIVGVTKIGAPPLNLLKATPTHYC